MEDLGINRNQFFGSIYRNRKVLVTGHTGFKGSWMVSLLRLLGADVVGFALPPDTSPAHFSLLDHRINSVLKDINNYKDLLSLFSSFKPEIVFHLAAQPLVIESYNNPLYTFQTNIMGTVNLLECCRHTGSVRAIVVVTTDKVYENDDWKSGYTEKDRLGGHDPYSASKASAEIVCDSYRKSFFSSGEKLLATARAGNVIGGGDWAKDRLIPDIIRASYSGSRTEIRNPGSVRPWQHVLESLSGYLTLGLSLLEGKKENAEAWNFGPEPGDCISVAELISLSGIAEKFKYASTVKDKFHESNILKLDSSKAHEKLGWKPVWGVETAIKKTMNWYRSYYTDGKVLTNNDIRDYLLDAVRLGVKWTRL